MFEKYLKISEATTNLSSTSVNRARCAGMGRRAALPGCRAGAAAAGLPAARSRTEVCSSVSPPPPNDRKGNKNVAFFIPQYVKKNMEEAPVNQFRPVLFTAY